MENHAILQNTRPAIFSVMMNAEKRIVKIHISRHFSKLIISQLMEYFILEMEQNLTKLRKGTEEVPIKKNITMHHCNQNTVINSFIVDVSLTYVAILFSLFSAGNKWFKPKGC